MYNIPKRKRKTLALTSNFLVFQGPALDELSDEEQMSAKPQAAKAAESLIEATMTEEQKTLEKE